jgi:hypothetical protein
MAPFFSKIQIRHFQVPKISWRNSRCSQWCRLPLCKIPRWNTLFSRLQKKWKHLTNVEAFKISIVHYFRSTILWILHSPKYRVFFWHSGEVHYFLPLQNLFIIFWNYELPFSNFGENRFHVACAPKCHTPQLHAYIFSHRVFPTWNNGAAKFDHI